MPPDAGAFDEEEVAGLDEPVRRYLTAAIAPGTALARAVRVTMRGRINLGRWLPFRGREVLAPHEGFVWSARVAGLITGSDHSTGEAGALDWRVLGMIPVAHDDGRDVARSGAGRAAGEAVWAPTALLPRFGTRWQAVDDHCIVAAVSSNGGTETELTLELDRAHQVASVTFPRWGDPEDTGSLGWHPFSMVASTSRTFGGFTVPAVGSAGWGRMLDGRPEAEFFRFELTDVAPALSVSPPSR